MEEDEYSSGAEEVQDVVERPKKKMVAIRTPPEEREEEETGKPKQKRKVSEEARKVMLANLEKARATRAANRRNVTKYPKHKRDRALEMYQKDVESKAQEKLRLLAEETLRKKEEEKELEQFRKWKANQGKEGRQDRVPPRTSRKKTPVPKSSKKGKISKVSSSKNSASLVGKGSKKDMDPVQSAEETPMQYAPYYSISTGWNIDDFLG